MWRTGTVTFCWDFRRETMVPKGTHTNRWGKRLRSWRAWGGPFAIGYYRMDDRDVVSASHDWED